MFIHKNSAQAMETVRQRAESSPAAFSLVNLIKITFFKNAQALTNKDTTAKHTSN